MWSAYVLPGLTLSHSAPPVFVSITFRVFLEDGEGSKAMLNRCLALRFGRSNERTGLKGQDCIYRLKCEGLELLALGRLSHEACVLHV